MNVHLILAFVYNLSFTCKVVRTCTFPDEWDGLWYDSRNTEVTLDQATSAVLSGWSVSAYSSTVTSWTCVEQSADTYLLKSDQEVNAFHVLHWAYLCLRITKVTDVSYRYTIMADEQKNAGNERVTVLSMSRNASISGDCEPVSPPGAEEYHVLVKADNVSSTSIRQYFPGPLLAILYNSAYVKTDPTCESDVILDMCSIRTTLNRTECSTSSGQVSAQENYCITYVQDGNRYYVSVLDPQVTGSGQQRMKCLAVSKLNNLIYISDNTGSCAKGQDPEVKQVNGNEALVMFANVLCPFETSSAEEEATYIGLIIGCVIAGVIFLGILVVLIICLRKKTRNKIVKSCTNKCKRKKKQEENKSQQRTLSSHKVKEIDEIQKNSKIRNDNNEEGSCILILDNLNDSKIESSAESQNIEHIEGPSLLDSSNDSTQLSNHFQNNEIKHKTFILGNLKDSNHNYTDGIHTTKRDDEFSSFENLNDSKHEIREEGRGIARSDDRELEDTLHQPEESSSESFISSETNIEFGAPPVDERGDFLKCSPCELDSVMTVNDFSEADDGYTSVDRSNSQKSSELRRQTTEKDMEELRRLNRQIHLDKQLFYDSHISFDPNMTSCERNYFEKSVFAKQNVEAEMYLNAIVSTFPSNTPTTFSETDNFEDKTVSSVETCISNLPGSLSMMSGSHDQSLNLNLKHLTPNPVRANDIVPLRSNSSIKVHNPQNSKNKGRVLIEEYEFSLTDEQRSCHSTTMSSGLSNRVNERKKPSASEIEGKREDSVVASRYTARIMNRPRSSTKVFAFPVHESGAISKPETSNFAAEPVLKRSITDISRLKIPARKPKVRNHDNETKAPKMKFRWI